MRGMYMQQDNMWKFHAITFDTKEVNINFKEYDDGKNHLVVWHIKKGVRLYTLFP